MLPSPMPLRECRLLVCQRIDEVNALQQPRTHVRLVRYGDQEEKTEKEFTTHPRAVTIASRHALLYVLQRCRKQVEKVQKMEQRMPGLWAQHVTDTGDQVPPITFNCVELSRRLGTCEKSIRTYVQQWLAAGIVTKKKFHGRKANLELWINPAYLWKTPLKTVQTPVSEYTDSTHIGHILSTNGKNLPPKSFQNPQETLPTVTCDVEKLHSDPIRKPFSGSGGLQQGPEPGPTALKAQEGAKQTTSGTIGAGGAAMPTSSLDEVHQHGFVTSLRIYAEKLLYPGKSYSVERMEKTIREGVFNNFIDHFTLEQWTQFHGQCMRRIELMRDFVLRKPDSRFTPVPYSERTPGTGWFDWENEKGFRGTEKWLLDNLKREHERKLTDAVQLAVNELVARRKYEAHQNPTKMKASKRVKALSRMDLYQFHFKRLYRLGGDRATNQLNAKVAALLT